MSLPRFRDGRGRFATIPSLFVNSIPFWKEKVAMSVETQENLPAIVEPDVSTQLENTEMVRSLGNRISDMLVGASTMAKQVATWTKRIEELTNALAVANETAAKALEERDQARRELAQANSM